MALAARQLVVIVMLAVAATGKLADAQNSPSYVIVAPRYVGASSPYDVTVTIINATDVVNVTARLLDTSYKQVVANYTLVNSGTQATISLQVPRVLSSSAWCTLVVEGYGGISFYQSYIVNIKTKSMSFFIQTDKSIYKPSQKVLFRVIAVLPDLKPYTGEISVTISDNSGNKIAQWLNAKNNTGVLTYSLQLSDQPPLGAWSIVAAAQANNFTKTFQVAEYVLPKFEVSVDLPSYYLVLINKKTTQQDLHARITARYTYGQPVRGPAVVKVTVSNAYGSETVRRNSRYQSKIFNVQLVQGSAEVVLNITDLLDLTSYPQYIYGVTVDQLWTYLSQGQILVEANVTENVTGKVLSGSSSVSCTPQKYTLSFMDITSSSFKPGLLFNGYLQLKQFDGSSPLLTDIRSGAIAITATLYFPSTTSTFNVSIDASGLAIFSLFVPDMTYSVYLTGTCYDTSTNNSLYVSKSLIMFNSYSDEGVQLSLDNSGAKITSGQTVTFTMKSTVDVTTFSYQLLSKDTVVKSASVTGPPASTHQLNITFDRPLVQKLVPNGRLLVWYITSIGEIVSDSLEFSVSGEFANNVSVSFNKDTVQPADDVNINVTCYGGSYVGLLAVDQSVLLLQSGNDVTQDEVLDDLSQYDESSKQPSYCRGCWWSYYSGGTNTYEVFTKAGVIVLTDAYVYPMRGPYTTTTSTRLFTTTTTIFWRLSTNLMTIPGLTRTFAPTALAPMTTTQAPHDEPAPEPSTPPVVRQNFPETWLWTDLTAGPDGRATLKATVPDTITSWVLSAFAVSPEVGLGIARDVAELTVFKSFFVSLDLPYSIKRGEEFALQVTVFNYLSSSVKVTVTLKRSDYFKVHLQNDILPQAKSVTTNVEVASNDATSAFFWIVPDSLGQIPIEVSAISGLGADAARVMLLVEPEGVPQEYSTSVFFSQSAGQTSNATLNISLPSDGTLVPGSEYFEVTVIGDLMGQSLTGLGNLLKMPYGCGEQNMLTFAPDVYILKYLHITGKTAESTEADALGYITAGYQRELTYQRRDGSFSAFGDSDLSGSIWLSSFVIKCFHEARQFIPVEDSKILATLSWILTNQARDGSFHEPPNGRVIHTDMQGGSAGGVPLTAYVLISLMENSDNTLVSASLLQTARDSAVRYLESQLSNVTSDPYALSIITYALTVSGSTSADSALQSLNALAVMKDGMKYWHKSSDVDVPSSSWKPPYPRARSVDIEMTSYALLTYARGRDFTGGIPIAKWIVSQRNSLGGFSSTQDTVVALQALSEFAALTSGSSSGTPNLIISLQAGFLQHQFNITLENVLILQSVQIPSSAKTVYLQATGGGLVGLVQLNVKYNVYRIGGSSFVQLGVNHTQTGPKQMSLNIDARWLSSDPSGMAIIKANLPTGYSADNVDQLQSQSSIIRRVDSDERSIVFYLDQLTTAAVRVNLIMSKVKIVDNVQPAAVEAYLYYDPGQRDTLLYQPPPANISFCDQCPLCCNCNTDASFLCADGICLNASARCNGVRDCSDGADELECQANESTKMMSSLWMLLILASVAEAIAALVGK